MKTSQKIAIHKTVIDPNAVIALGHCIVNFWMCLLHVVTDLNHFKLIHESGVQYSSVLHTHIITDLEYSVNQMLEPSP